MKEKKLIKLFENWANEKAKSIFKLAQSGSYREYYRIESENKKAIAVFNEDEKENIAFLNFTRHFAKKKFNVPKIFAENLNENIYLLQDLGNETLFQFLGNRNFVFNEEVVKIYEKVLLELIKFQIDGHQNLDYSVAYPRSKFDKLSISWDLNYFKYYFLKLAKIPFNEQNLENDFETFIAYLLEENTNYFLYRDFQSRNIMLLNNEVYFIDYQGGRKGALQYDIASLLYDAKANIPQKIRENLLDFYIKNLKKRLDFDKKNV